MQTEDQTTVTEPEPEGAETQEETTTTEETQEKGTALTAALKKELKNREELKGIKDVSDLARKYLDVLSNSEKVEVPETPDGYELKLTGELADKAKALDNDEGRKAFGNVLKQLGISKKHGSDIYNLVVSSMVSMEDARNKAIDEGRKKAEEELKKELGDKYKDVFSQTLNSLKKVSDDDFIKFLNESKVGNDPRFVKAVYKLMQLPVEDRLETGEKAAPEKPGVFVFKNTPPQNSGG